MVGNSFQQLHPCSPVYCNGKTVEGNFVCDESIDYLFPFYAISSMTK